VGRRTLEAWANARPHEPVALQMVYDHRTIPANRKLQDFWLSED
jgi:hypothetical protein